MPTNLPLTAVQVIDSLPDIRARYAGGLALTRKSLLWDLVSLIPWNRVACAALPPPVAEAQVRVCAPKRAL
jgi:hypothetical protein